MATATSVLEAPITFAPTKPPQVNYANQPGFRELVICSIWPKDLFAQRRLHVGRPTYHMPAAPRGGYRRLAIYDTQQIVTAIDPLNGKKTMMPAPIPVEVIAECLLDEWVRDIMGSQRRSADAKPGIGILPPGMQEPSEEWLATARAGQEKFMEWAVNDAIALAQAKDYKSIVDGHRDAARWLYGERAEMFDWFGSRTFLDVKQCLMCKKQIEANAIKCSHCSENLVDLYIKYGLPLEDDPAVAAFIAKMQKRPLPPPLSVPDAVVAEAAAKSKDPRLSK